MRVRKKVFNPWKDAWFGMRRRAGNKDGNHPAYASVKLLVEQEEFYRWYKRRLRAFNVLFPGERPSVDRIDPTGHYEFSNLRLLPVGLNSRLRRNARKYFAPEGMQWCSGCQQDHSEVTAARRMVCTTFVESVLEHVGGNHVSLLRRWVDG